MGSRGEFSDALHRQIAYFDISPEEWEGELKRQGIPEHVMQHLLTMGELHRAGRYDRQADGVERGDRQACDERTGICGTSRGRVRRLSRGRPEIGVDVRSSRAGGPLQLRGRNDPRGRSGGYAVVIPGVLPGASARTDEQPATAPPPNSVPPASPRNAHFWHVRCLQPVNFLSSTRPPSPRRCLTPGPAPHRQTTQPP